MNEVDSSVEVLSGPLCSVSKQFWCGSARVCVRGGPSVGRGPEERGWVRRSPEEMLLFKYCYFPELQTLTLIVKLRQCGDITTRIKIGHEMYTITMQCELNVRQIQLTLWQSELSDLLDRSCEFWTQSALSLEETRVRVMLTSLVAFFWDSYR